MHLPDKLDGKAVWVTGGSGGLGKAIAKLMAARGAHVTIFARNQASLNDARDEIQASAMGTHQKISAVSLDMADASKVEDVFKAQPQPADVLYCAAGGNHAENGFLVDISAAQLDQCMKNNYYAALYPTKALFDIWTRQDGSAAAAAKDQPTRTRRVVFVSSAAAFVSLPGSVAYSPAKCALRSLADTLRLEALRYSCESSTYSIHIAFPGDFVSPGFYLEQDTKTPLTKRMQGTDCSVAELETKFPTADHVAAGICGAVDREDFIICADSASASLLFTGMIGPSPKRGLGLFDSVVGIVIGWLVWPVLRRRWERWCRADSVAAGSK